MISYIAGTLMEKAIDRVVIEAGGLGYEINIPASTLGKLPSLGTQVKLYVSESTGMYSSSTSLYGFYSLEEKAVFLLLKSISKIGAKGALEILSKASKSFHTFNKAIRERDAKTLVGVFNLTKKTADKLILGLKDKVAEIAGSEPEQEKSRLKNLQDVNDAVAGLMALGFSQNKSREAVEQATQDLETYQTAELIKHSLKILRG
jgi:holliday junction DNA helicase RuvA